MESSLAVVDGNFAIMPVMNVAMAIDRREQIRLFISKIMNDGVDYGVIPGTGDRPALLKAGAEKLTTLFGLTKKFTILEKVEDWSGDEHGGEPFFYYVYRCSLLRGDLLIAEADGSCNSHESKYRYRKSQRVCPKCGQETIKKSKKDDGWYCWAKIGGCGATFRKGDQSIEGQETGRVINPDVADQANTILKMAQKRALVAATLLGTSASEFFSTKDVPGRDEDDLPIDPQESRPAPAAPPFEEAEFNPVPPDQSAPLSQKQTNGKKLTRRDYINRISEIELQLVEAGSGVDIDQAFLDTASIDDLVKFGKEMKAKLETIKAASPVLPGMEAQSAGAYSE